MSDRKEADVACINAALEAAHHLLSVVRRSNPEIGAQYDGVLEKADAAYDALFVEVVA